MKRFLSLLVSLAVLCLMFASCKSEEKDPVSTVKREHDPNTLWVVSEHSLGVNGSRGDNSPVFSALTRVVAFYQTSHPGSKVDLQMIPAEGSEREIVLQSLRTQIMSGDGPDVFLLPSGSVPGSMGQQEQDGLFRDVEVCMRNGNFADLSAYYDADTELNKEDLQQEIMDAGCYDGKRYVLPIRWDMPVVCADQAKLEKAGLDVSLFSKGALPVIDAVLETGDLDLIFDANFLPECVLCLFPNLLDYESGEVRLTQEEMEDFFKKRKAIADSPWPDSFEPGGTAMLTNLISYSRNENGEFALSGRGSYYMTTLKKCVDMVGMAKAQGVEMLLLPLPATDGSTVAEITYFGAVNAGSDKTEAAYHFLRCLLTPDVQFQTIYQGNTPSDNLDLVTAWPVRVKGSVASEWAAAVDDMDAFAQSEVLKERIKKIHEIKPTDDDLPLLSQKLDQVRFATPLDYELYKRIENPSGPEKDAKEFLEAANYHLAES